VGWGGGGLVLGGDRGGVGGVGGGVLTTSRASEKKGYLGSCLGDPVSDGRYQTPSSFFWGLAGVWFVGGGLRLHPR